MNKNYLTIFATAALVLATGCVTAGTWVNGYYIDGPLCTVCDGARVVTHAYGTTVCTHCDGTGIEPPANEMVIVENTVVVDTWCLPPPRWHHRRPIVRRNPPRACRPHHSGGWRHMAHPARPVAKACPAAPRRSPRPAVRPARGGAGRGGGRNGRR